ncbi:MAG: DNA-binding transcriptional MocR family regulator [Porticoccus sp.]|jgi:DNA-binding transcriptional MocR family regulator|uniref:aminotransferase-like domain-containing protein n=1 Tax=Porticoccus sp. TaxID=2024853 RepID=UPI0039E303C6
METLYQQVANELKAGIERGIYQPGDRLPGVRTLSKQRNVSIATVITAYRHLEDAGLIEARNRSGYYLREKPLPLAPEPLTSRPPNKPVPVNGQALVLNMGKASHDPSVIQLGAAVPDASFLPVRAIERAITEAARYHRNSVAAYEFPPGLPALRRQIARRMVEAGCPVHPDEIVITNGCQEALSLALRAVTTPGDVVAVESPTFYGLLQVIDNLGLKALEIPTHPRTGISLEALELALEQWPIKACAVTPNFSNPLGSCMPGDHKTRLVELLASHDIPLVEDDVYGDLGFSTVRPSICKALSPAGDVLYCGSFSKTLAPGLRIGWIVPGRHQQQVEYMKYVLNLATPTIPQLAVASLLEGGQYERHLRKVKNDYALAVSRMSGTVMALFPEGTRITRPEGGFVIWVELPKDVNSLELAQQAMARGISIAPGPIFSASRKYRNFIRLSCACRWDETAMKALSTLAALLARKDVSST